MIWSSFICVVYKQNRHYSLFLMSAYGAYVKRKIGDIIRAYLTLIIINNRKLILVLCSISPFHRYQCMAWNIDFLTN